MRWSWLWLVVYFGILMVPVVVTTLWAQDFNGTISEIAKCMALSGFMILSLQFFLAARLKRIERPFGLDILIRYHKHMAVFAALLLLSHPVLLAIGGSGWRLILGLDLPWYIWTGKAALIILIFNVLLSLYQRSLKLKFEHWRLFHDVLGPVLLALAFVHSWFAGDDLALPSMKALWLLALILTALIYVYHRILRPRRLRDHPFRVIDVVPETEDVWTVKMAPPEGDTLYPYLPGQFHFVTFYRKEDLPVEEHHWTISSSPAEKAYVSSTIKALGDFTSTIGRTAVGDRAAIHGAFGRFSYALHPEQQDLVFIAGGIGITPLMSMLRHMRDTRDSRAVLLFYANPDEDRIVFHQELMEIEKGGHPLLKVVHVLSRPGEDWSGERGHVDREKIKRFCGRNLHTKTFYICGPRPMLKAVTRALRDLGVADRQIREEIFSFLD
ncbi:MAG: ferric reductase-like transmembrane domain-containing protein [Desulfatiglandales bacterium]